MGSLSRSAELGPVTPALSRFAEAAGVGLASFVAVSAMAIARGQGATVGAGAPTTSPCSDRAAISYATTYSAKLPGYIVTKVPIRSGPDCAHQRYELIVSDASRHRKVCWGRLDARGAATVIIGDEAIDAASVSVAVVIAG
jgi:hypothetical protein